MSRLLSFLFALVVICGPITRAPAQSDSKEPAGEFSALLQQNRLIADVARDDPDGLWALVRKLQILTTARRDGGASRSGSTATPAEAAQIEENPALRRAHSKDPAATLALLRSTNEALRRAQLRQMPARRVALVIGSGGDAAWGRLATARNDANLIATALSRQGFDLFEGRPLIDPDRRRLLQAIKNFSRTIGPETVAFIYYAGHGVQLNGRNFLVPVGAAMPRTSDDYERDLVPVDDALLRAVQQGDPRLNIVVLDACRDLPSPAPDRIDVQGRLRPRRGLAPMSAPPHTNGTVIIYSTEPNDVARDSVSDAPDSPFASAFAAAIEEPGLELREVFDRVQAAVDRATNHQQQPWISYSGIGKFYFGATVKPAPGMSIATVNDGPFHCPKAGSTIKLAIATGSVEGTYQAVDPADPVSCRIVTSAGEAKTLLDNFFDAKSLSGEEAIRKGMDGLLSKHKDRAEFEVATIGSLYRPDRETWKRLGTEILRIGNQFVRTVRFERVRQVMTNSSGYQDVGVWKLWYDPATGIFVRSEPVPTTVPGLGNGGIPGSFQVMSLGPS